MRASSCLCVGQVRQELIFYLFPDASLLCPQAETAGHLRAGNPCKSERGKYPTGKPCPSFNGAPTVRGCLLPAVSMPYATSLKILPLISPSLWRSRGLGGRAGDMRKNLRLNGKLNSRAYGSCSTLPWVWVTQPDVKAQGHVAWGMEPGPCWLGPTPWVPLSTYWSCSRSERCSTLAAFCNQLRSF